MSDVYVLHVGTDCNYTIVGVWADPKEATAAALETIQDMWDARGWSEDPPFARPTSYDNLGEWNEFWDTEPDMIVTLHVVPFTAAQPKKYQVTLGNVSHLVVEAFSAEEARGKVEVLLDEEDDEARHHVFEASTGWAVTDVEEEA